MDYMQKESLNAALYPNACSKTVQSMPVLTTHSFLGAGDFFKRTTRFPLLCCGRPTLANDIW